MSTTGLFDTYELVTVRGDSEEMQEVSKGVPWALHMDSGRIIYSGDLDMEDYLDMEPGELFCVICLEDGREGEESTLKLTPRGVAKGYFEHKVFATHSVEDVWHAGVVMELSRIIEESTKKAVVRGETFGTNSPNAGLLVTGSHAVQIEIQTNSALKTPVWKWHEDFRKNRIQDQWISPVYIEPGIVNGEYRSIAIAEKVVEGIASLQLGTYVAVLQIEILGSGKKKLFHVPLAKRQEVIESLPDSVNAVSHRYAAIMSDIGEWSFGGKGFSPSWGTPAFDLAEVFEKEHTQLLEFIRVDPSKHTKGGSKGSEAVSGEIYTIDNSGAQISRKQLQWFILTYFRYRNKIGKEISMTFASNIDFDSLSGDFTPEDMGTGRKVSSSLMKAMDTLNEGAFWKVEFVGGKKWRFSLDPKWMKIVHTMVSVHSVSAEGVNRNKLNLIPYTGEINAEKILPIALKYQEKVCS